ncbi:11489_t:CDS:2 [Entrophospora sp. SA101]|nr:11489_t:CDS:2 [Entrophospora sp. SA101]
MNSVSAGTVDEWRSRTIYQLLTDRFAQSPGQENPSLCSNNFNETEIRHYCGGTFNGIVNKLDYLKNLGFDAIWISPVVKQVEAETKYGVDWAQDLYQINEHFGTSDDLKNLVKAAHDKGIWVMVDVVANHMGPQDGKKPGTEDYVKIYNPFNKTEDYHFYCPITNYKDPGNVEYCSVGGDDLPLPDLNTENPSVASELNKWIKWLVSEFNFDGIRIDTVRHIPHSFWSGFAKSSGVFSIGEILDGDPRIVASYQGLIDSTLGYPLYFKISYLFINPGANMYEIRDVINNDRNFFKDTSVLGNFIDCHDKPRLQHLTSDQVLIRNVLTFVLLFDGIPIVYQGTEQGFSGPPTGEDPYNREALWPSNYKIDSPLYQFISNINAFRKILPTSYFTSLSIEAWINEHIYSFVKDRALIVTSNYGSNNPNIDLIIQGNGRWNVGDNLINVVKCEEVVVIDKDTNVPVKIDGEPKVFYPRDLLKNSGVCGL